MRNVDPRIENACAVVMLALAVVASLLLAGGRESGRYRYSVVRDEDGHMTITRETINRITIYPIDEYCLTVTRRR